jgi:hypothetical protein
LAFTGTGTFPLNLISREMKKLLYLLVSKFQGMKKFVVALILAAGVTAIAFAALNTKSTVKKSIHSEKKEVKKMQKKECRRTCLYSI